MEPENHEEVFLRQKLSDLEKRYKESLFATPVREKLEGEIRKDLLEEVQKNRELELQRRRAIEEEIQRIRDAEAQHFLQERETIKKPEFSKTVNLPPLEIKRLEITKPDLSVVKKPEVPATPPLQAIQKPQYTQEIHFTSKYRNSSIPRPTESDIKKCAISIKKMKDELSKVVIGQEEILDGLILGLLCNAHVLVEGVPGIAKTLAIRSLGAVSGCIVKRVQFTVDMLPTDIIGITTYTPEKGFSVIKGPVFTNFLIADEINRSPPKTQSALIEAMQEKQVTIGRKNYTLPAPFFVMATENPIENAGVYPLPEAQIDRFLFKLIMPYPKPEEEMEVMGSNMTLQRFEDFKLKSVATPEEIVWMQEVVKRVYLDDNIRAYILSIVTKTRDKDFKNSEYLTYGSSPRASIGLFIASKARALMQGRAFVLPEDVKDVAFSILRHRLILSYKATIQKISPDSLIQEILNSIRVV